MTSRWLPTSEGAGLIASLARQPLLLVFRPSHPLHLAPILEQLQGLGLLHAELAFQPNPHWAEQCRSLIRAFPAMHLGVASIVSREALAVAIEAGFAYGMAPFLHPQLQEAAAAAGFVLVPGVMTPSEVRSAWEWGPGLVKLFPAATLGPAHWSRLREPFGGSLPFCIAAGGIPLDAVRDWLDAGVDAVAVGSRWIGVEEDSDRETIALDPLAALLAHLSLPR